jgi:flagellar assembly protein FliH
MTSIRILKGASIRDVVSQPAFNFVDLEREADDVVSRARREAEQLLCDARQSAEAIREQARSDGYADGMADAQAKIEQVAIEHSQVAVEERLRTALPALTSAAGALQAERDRWLIRWEQTAIRVGVAIAGKLLKSQIATRPELATGMIADALRLAAGQPKVTVHLHPEDLVAWDDQGPRIVESLTACADSTLIADPMIARGGCRIETVHGEIDARVESMLERLANELIDG